MRSLQEILDLLENEAAQRAEENDEGGCIQSAKNHLLHQLRTLDPMAYEDLK